MSHAVVSSVERCLNCQHDLHGASYCPHCGQSARAPARITLAHLLHELPHVVWHVDKGVLYTLREMWQAPGPTIRRYLAGERARFFQPFSLLLLLAGVSSFIYLALHIQPYYRDPHASAKLLESQEQVIRFVTKYQAWVQISELPLSALLVHWFLRSRTHLNYAEHLVATTLLAGAFTGFSFVFTPALWYWSGTPTVQTIAFTMTATMLAYRTWAYAQLQEVGSEPAGRFRRWGRATALVLVDYLLLTLLIGGAMVLLIVLHR